MPEFLALSKHFWEMMLLHWSEWSKPLLQHQVLLKVHCKAFQGFEGHSVFIIDNGACFKTKMLQGEHIWVLSGCKKWQLIPIIQYLGSLIFAMGKTQSLDIYNLINWCQEWCQHQFEETTAENGELILQAFLVDFESTSLCC